MPVNIGSAWLTIKPEMDGVSNSIRKGLKGTGTSVSSDMSGELVTGLAKGAAIGSVVGGLILAGVKAVASKVTAAVSEMMSDAVDTMDQVIGSKTSLSTMGFDTGEIENSLKRLKENATSTAASYGDLADGALSLTASWGDLEYATKSTQALSDAILSFNKGADGPMRVANAITQISQVPIDGPLDGQTWLSLRNSGLMPVISAVAEMNGMDVSGLKEALSAGELTTRDFMDALIQLDETTYETLAKNSAAATFSGSIGAAKESISTSISEVLESLWTASGAGNLIIKVGDKISNGVSSVSKLVTNTIKGSSENIASIMPKIEKLGNSISKLAQAVLKPVIGILNKIFASIKDNERVSTIVERLGELFSKVADMISRIAVVIGSIWDAIEPIMGPIISFLADTVLRLIGNIISVISTILDVLNPIWDVIAKEIGSICAWIQVRIESVSEFLTKKLESLNSSLDYLETIVKNVLVYIKDKYNEYVQPVVDKIISFLETVGSEYIGPAVDWAIDGLKSISKWLGNVTEKCSGLTDKLTRVFDKFSGQSNTFHLTTGYEFAGGGYAGRGAVHGVFGEAGKEVALPLQNNTDNWSGLLANTLLNQMRIQGLSEPSNGTKVVQNNTFNINDSLDMQQIVGNLGYAVAMA